MNIADLQVNVPYATTAAANKIKAWARKNTATVRLNRYARDAYDGDVVIHSGPLDTYEATASKASDLRKLLHSLGCIV